MFLTVIDDDFGMGLEDGTSVFIGLFLTAGKMYACVDLKDGGCILFQVKAQIIWNVFVFFQVKPGP